MAKYVSAYEGAKRDKEKKKKYVSAYSEAEKNKYGIPGAVGYIAGRAGTDFLRVGEGVVDAALVPVDLMMGNVDRAKSRFMDSPVDAMRERLDEEYNPGKVAGFIGDIAGGIGQSVGYGLISAIPYAGKPMMYSSIVEQGISSAAEQTGKVGLKEIGYGATVGAIEGTLESKLGAGVKGIKSLGSAILKKTGLNVAESAAKAGGKSMLKSVLTETAKGFAGEFAEEAISEAVDPALLRLYNIDENAQFSLKDVAYAGLIGGLSGGIMSAGPAAINYRSAVSVGRAIQESRLDGELIKRARYTLSALEAAQTRSTGQIKGKPEGDTKETAKERLSRTSENRRVKRLSKETAQLADKIRRNIAAYENSMKDPAMAQSEPVAAILGELRGNLFLVGYAYEADVIEQVMMEADDKQRQAFVDAINEELAAQGKKHDYTLADFDANKDDIRRGLAGRLMMDELRGNTAEGGIEYGAEATEKPAQAATSPWDGMADNEDMSGYKAAGEAENALLRAAVNQSVPRGSVQAMLDEYRKGTDLTPEEFAAGWSDGAHIYGRYGLNVDEASPLSRMSPEAREAAMKFGRETEEAERKAAEEKAKAKKKPAAQAGKKGTVVRGEGLNIQKLSNEQYAAYKAAEVLAEVLGTDIVIETKILTKKGKEANGYYDRGDNTIHININALRNGKNVALYTLGHEVTHYIKEWSPTKFEALADFVLEQMGVDAEEAIADKLASLKRLGVVKDTMTVAEANAMAREELVTEGMELVLTDGKVLEELAKTDKTLWEKIRDWFFDIIGQIRRSWQDLNQASKTAQVLKETVESLEEIERLFTEGVREAGERTRTAESGETAETEGDLIYSPKAENGVMIDPASGTAMLSVDDIPKTEQEIDDAVNRLVAKLGVDESRARQWVQNELSLATLILRDDMVDYAHRKADRRLTAIVKNSDYKQGTLDFSNICRKRREYTRMMQRIQQAFPNRRFTAEEFATIRKIMVDEGLEVACGLCYVEDRRQNEGYIAETFQRAVEAWRKGNRDTYYDTKNNVENAYNKGQAKAMAMLEGGDYVPTIADLTTVEGMNKLQAEHKDILQAWKAFNNARGMSSARLLTNEAEYQRQILKYNKARVKAINDLGGLRVFSFSDFEEFHLLDIVQAVQDCAAMGIKIQFYTKVPSFALLMADTKAKGNLSLIPKGDLGYEMKNGKRVLVYDPVEGIDFNDHAFKEVARGNPNIGTILVGVNDEHIRTAMEDDFIDYIIPFHTGQTEVVRQIKKIGKWQNYKNEQVDKPWESGSKAKPVNVYTDVIAAAEREGDPIRNERQFVERFLKVCEERGLRPRFSNFLNTNAEGKYVYTKGYYKLLLDFKMFDKDGTYLPQEPVIPEFDADLLHELTKKYVAGEKAKTEAESPAFKRALERVEAEVVGDDEGRMYSIDETPETPDVSETRDLTDREILGMALEGAVQNEDEWKIVKSYREQAAMLELAREKRDGYSKEAAALERQIKALRARMEDEGDPDGWIRKAMDDAIAKKREAERMRDEQVKILDNADRELLRMKAAKPFREILAREQKRVRAAERRAERAEEVADRKVERARESAEKKITREKERMEEQSKQSRERKEITIRMREARRVLGYLNTMLYHPTKQKHVPESLQALVEKALRSADPKQFGINRDHIREMSELAGKIRNLESKAGRTTAEQGTLDKMKTKYEKLEADTISVKRQAEALMTAFEQYVTSTADGDQIDKNMLEGLRQTVTEIEEAPLNEMTLESLKAVEKIYTVIYHQVNTANQAFATEKAASIDEMSTEANTQVKNAKELKVLSPRSREWAALAGFRSFLWKNMKPLTVFEAIGSDKLMEIFRRVLDAEDVWITDILEAKKALDEAKKEFGYNKWNLKERREVTTADGSKVSLTLGEMMSLYAYMFREQAEEHLSVGGFVFAPNAETIESFKGDKGKYRAYLNDQTTHRMRKEDIAKMSELLTEEQRAYAKAVQEYLTSLGKKGNEVSSKLYGIDLFKETAYFPIKSSHDYIETSTGKSGDPNIKSRGTFKETVPKAGNPIVLEDFMEVVGNHVNTMATYHAFVLPVEDLTRVWNYTPVNIKRDADGKAILDKNGMPVADTEGEAGYNSLKAEITKKYGKEANDYILQLLRDLNGGARRESAASILDKGLTAFKRSATMLSLSTIVQQPTSIIRAMAYVDAKHFTGASFVPWETVKKYAPVAAIKEMGGFDTGTGARTAEYINAKEYDSIKDAAKAAVTPEIYGGDPNVRAEAFGWLTGKADEVAWRYMFGAIVNEQAEKLGKAKDSEEVLKAAGKRFAEVVRRTQVYDSTLTRSEFMRSKDGLMKMATAFGAEPTTVLSMAAEAIIKLERGDKSFFKNTAAAIAGSILVNAVISSIIYAMRDDDEEKNILEKYTESVTSEIIEGFNPLEYLPIARDVMSIFKGYDIERTDMSLISNLYQQIELLTSSKRSPADKIAGVSGAVGAFFGLPITNVYRDAKGIVLTTAGILDPEPVTGRGMGNAVGQGIKGQAGLLGKIFGKERGDSYELYQAYVKGDKAHYNRVAARYKTEADLEYALRRELRENDKRIVEAAEARLSGDIAVYESLVDQIEAEGIFDRNITIRAINNEVSELKRAAEKGELVPKDETATDEEETPESLYTSSDLNAALERGDTEDFNAILAALVEDKVSTGKTEDQAKASVKSSITAYWKKQYLSGYQDTETRKRIIKLLTDTGMYGSRNDVATMCESWVKASK